MRPRYQQGQICHGGSNWVLRYHEDRAGVDGRVKRVRTMSTLAPFAEHPYKGSPADLDKLRELFHDKITAILAPINRENPTVKAAFTLGGFIKQNYFLRLEYRLGVPTDNELHIEPATVKATKTFGRSTSKIDRSQKYNFEML